MRVWPFRWPYMYPFVVGIQVRSCIHIFCHIHIFTRAPHQAGMHSLHQTMNPHFFSSLAPRLPHVVQALKAPPTPAWSTWWSGRRKKRRSGTTVPWCVFLQTVHLDANDIAVRPEHSVLVEEEADVETIQAVRWMIHSLDVLLQLQKKRWSAVRVGFPASGTLSRLASCCSVVRGIHIFSPKKTSLPASVSLSHNRVEKAPTPCTPSQSCLRWFAIFNLSLLCVCATKTKRHTPRKGIKKKIYQESF